MFGTTDASPDALHLGNSFSAPAAAGGAALGEVLGQHRDARLRDMLQRPQCLRLTPRRVFAAGETAPQSMKKTELAATA